MRQDGPLRRAWLVRAFPQEHAVRPILLLGPERKYAPDLRRPGHLWGFPAPALPALPLHQWRLRAELLSRLGLRDRKPVHVAKSQRRDMWSAKEWATLSKRQRMRIGPVRGRRVLCD
jgi:hypothetical protein